jgi:hypothetical protein
MHPADSVIIRLCDSVITRLGDSVIIRLGDSAIIRLGDSVIIRLGDCDSVIIRLGDLVITRLGDSVLFSPIGFVRFNTSLFTTDTVHVRPRCGGGAVGSPRRTSHVREHPREGHWGVARQAPQVVWLAGPVA